MAQDNYAGLMKSYIKLLLKNNVDFYLIEDSKFTCNAEINDEKVAEDVISFDTGNVDYFVDWLHLSSSGREEFTKNFTEYRNRVMNLLNATNKYHDNLLNEIENKYITSNEIENKKKINNNKFSYQKKVKYYNSKRNLNYINHFFI
jgi:hypothetical protein